MATVRLSLSKHGGDQPRKDKIVGRQPRRLSRRPAAVPCSIEAPELLLGSKTSPALKFRRSEALCKKQNRRQQTRRHRGAGSR